MDSIQFLPGTYTGPFILDAVNGAPNHPVTISGSAAGEGKVIIDGKAEPGMDKQNNAFRLSDCSWIIIEGFTIRNCWTDIITANDVSWFSLRSCDIKGGKRVVYARERGSHHFLVHRTDPRHGVTVVYHGARDVPRSTLSSILRQAQLTVEEFLTLL